jgi:hypothetical protein
MTQHTASHLAPPHHERDAAHSCHVCGCSVAAFAQARILHKHDIRYFRCTRCGFIQTEQPYWLPEAYASPIASEDIGTANRASMFSRITATVILAFFDCNARFVDYGGGYGLFTRTMRDRGLDFYHFEKYCRNLFAQGFEAEPARGTTYELLTAWEVFEHLVDPVRSLEDMLLFSRSVLFYTLLIPPDTPPPGRWWYYALDTGQHVSFHTRESLSRLASRFSLALHTDGIGLHLLTDRRISRRLFNLVLHPRAGPVFHRLLRRRLKKQSLLEDDFFKVSGLRLT